MKICYITNLYPPYMLGGAELVVQKMAQQMKERGHEVTVITTSPTKKEEQTLDNEIPVYRINPTKIYPVYQQTNKNKLLKPLWHMSDLWNNKSLTEIKEILQKINPDIVHINNYKGLSVSCFKAPKELKIPIVFTPHDFSLICPRANLINKNSQRCKNQNKICKTYIELQNKLLNNNIDLVISPSQFIIDKFKENNLFKNTPTIKIPLGIDKSSYKSTKTYETIDIMYVGTLGKHKGVQTLITAFKHIPSPDIRLHIVGKGPDQEEFKQIASNDKRIIFHGFIENENVIKLIETANMMVVPSICYDNSPVVINESFITGTPVIGSKIGGIPENIHENVNGYLFEPENHDELKDHIIDLIKNTYVLKSLEKGAFNTVPDNSMDIMGEKLLKEYNKLINKIKPTI